ncbi:MULTISPECIES: hypothetical protein [Sphingobacterium]|uniref:hypothetical protein n=1 Tax=Sphingobacterium TaxID=28453 RepID=UPI000E9BA9AE|nr:MULTISPECIES: hypothetical protein [Sphingobacterium]HBX63483.1 hypothetical protein [Flavobacteriaceae bacterium]
MKKTDLFDISIKILGIFLVLFSINSTKELLLYNAVSINGTNMNEQNSVLLILWSNLILQLLIAFVFLLKSEVFVHFFIKDDPTDDKALACNKFEAYRFGFILIGITLVILSLPSFIVNLFKYIYLVQNDVLNRGFEFSNLVTQGIKLLLSIIIIFYATKISAYFSNSKVYKDNH